MVSVQRKLKYKSMRTMSVKIGPAWLPAEFILSKIPQCTAQDWIFHLQVLHSPDGPAAVTTPAVLFLNMSFSAFF